MKQLNRLLIYTLYLCTISNLIASESPAPPKAKDGKFITWKENRIDDSELAKIGLGGADGCSIGDLDKDGNIDVVAVHEDCKYSIRISFGSKDGKHWESFGLSDAVGAAEDVVIADINKDGNLDIVGCGEGGALVYFEAPKNTRNINEWKSISLTKVLGKSFTGRMRWIRVDTGDLDGDGIPEILAANKGGTHWYVFKNKGDTTSEDSWVPLTLGNSKTPINVRAIDIDNDGDIDVFGGSRGESIVDLFENLGNEKSWDQKWKPHRIISGKFDLGLPANLKVNGEVVKIKKHNKTGSSGFMLKFIDLDNDGKLDIVTETKHSGGIFWLKQPGKLSDPWPKHLIGHIYPDHATGIELADINGDGRKDLITGGYSYTKRRADPNAKTTGKTPCGRLAWFECPPDPSQKWLRHDISRRAQGMYDMFHACDVNKDGLIDFIYTRGNSSPLDGTIWLEQKRTDTASPVFTSSWPKEKESAQQSIPIDQK